MHKAVISGTGLYTPPYSNPNDELVESFNTFVRQYNDQHAEAIAKGDMNAVNYFVAQKYVEALKEFATGPNQKTMLLPVEATGILSSLAGIAELGKAATDDKS